MLEQLEQKLSSLLIRVRFAVFSRRHPEIARLTDHKERVWAMWFARAGSARWVRPALPLVVVVAGPLVVTGLVFLLFDLSGLLTRSTWPFLLLVCWAAGMGLCGLMMEGIGGRRRLRACFRSMRLSGHDICPRCGYDMVGHEVASVDHIRKCPECGQGVGILEMHRKTLRAPR